MSELSPKAAALVRAGRGGLRPSRGDEARIAEALRARLGHAVLPPDAAIGAGPAAHSAWVKLLAVVGAVGTIAGAAAFFAWEQPTSAPQAPARVALAVPAPAPAALPPASAAVEPVSNAVPPETSVVSARRAQDHLAREVAILSRATSELHAGRASSALKALDEHQRKFPNGLLAEERRAARAQALCALGRARDAEVELGRLAKSYPQSPNAARAREVCSNIARVK